MFTTIALGKWAIFALALVTLVSALLPPPVTAAYLPGDSGWGLWDAPPAYNIFSVWADDSSDNVFAVGQGGKVFRYDGNTWTTGNTCVTADLLDVWGSSSTDVFAIDSTNNIIHYDGATWQLMTTASKAIAGIWGSSDDDVFAVGNVGTILHYDGVSWTATASGTNHLKAVCGVSSDDVYAVGNSGTVIHYNGTAWSPVATSLPTVHLAGIWCVASDDVFAVGESGRIWHYDGSTWSDMPSNTNAALTGVWGTSSSDVFAVGAGGTILHYDGSNWTAMTSGTSNTLYGIHGRGPLDAFAVGQSGTILHYLEQGPPEITQVQPNRGVQGATIEFSITGTNLGWASNVTFGDGVNVTGFSSANSTSITGLLSIDPLAATGPRNISVTTQGGTAVLADGFVVDQALPAIDMVDPDEAIQGASLQINITGSYLEGASSISFGSDITVDGFTESPGCIAANITVSSTAIPGLRDITVVAAGGSVTLSNGFTVCPAPPTLASVAPSQAHMADTLSVTLAGTYLTGATALDFGRGIVVDSFTVDAPNQMTAQIVIEAGADIGPRDISVVTPGGTASLAGGFLVTLPTPPVVLSVTPHTANQGDAFDVIVTGSGFTTATSLSFGDGIILDSSTVQSETEILVSITVANDALSGARDISVTNPGGTGMLPGGFEIPSPTLLSIDCSQGYQGDTLRVVISGKNLSGTTEIDFGPGVTVEHFSVDTPDQITATIRIGKTAAPGGCDIAVTTPNGTATLEASFAIEEPGAIPVHTWILFGFVIGLVMFRLALFGLRRRHNEE